MIIKSKIEKAVRPEVHDPWDERMRILLARVRDKAKGYSEEEIVRIV